MNGRDGKIAPITDGFILDEKRSLCPTSSVCSRCSHLRFDPLETCDAFPGGVPDDIWYDQNNHGKPYPGDHGIQFEKFVAESEGVKKTA